MIRAGIMISLWVLLPLSACAGIAPITLSGGKILPLIRIQSSRGRPDDAFVSVPYRNPYFWIDDRDLMSKKILSFLMFVFTLVETGEKGTTPILTIPTG